MSRTARVVIPGYCYHLTQRGNNGRVVFHSDSDRRLYLRWLSEYSTQSGMKLLSYCLMDNHVHFIAKPEKEDSFSKTLSKLHMCYAQYYNKKQDMTGHLWQGRFYSCIMDQSHFEAAVRYVERNPVRSGLVKKPWDWPWSSAREHVGLGKCEIELENIKNYIEVASWYKYLDNEDKFEDIDSLRKCTRLGHVLGPAIFIQQLEKNVLRNLLPLPVGRPPKVKVRKIGSVPNFYE